MELAERGRITLIVFSVLTVTSSLIVVTGYVGAVGPQRLPVQIARLILTVALLAAVYRGWVVAKWILVALSTVSGALGIGLAARAETTGMLAFSLMLGSLHLAFARLLIWSPSVGAFLQRQNRPR